MGKLLHGTQLVTQSTANTLPESLQWLGSDSKRKQMESQASSNRWSWPGTSEEEELPGTSEEKDLPGSSGEEELDRPNP